MSLRVALAAGGILALLLATSGTAPAAFPGRPGKIAFSSDASGTDDLVVMNSDASGRESLTTGPEGDTDPAWSPDGRLLAFVRDGVVHVVRADGSGLRRLTAGSSPAWAPDGVRLVLSKKTARGADVYVIRSDARGLRRLTQTAAAESEPEWSPDGRSIAFVRSARTGSAYVYVMRPGGGGVRRVTNGPGEDLSPTWSPDSRQLAFVRDDALLGISRIFVTGLNGGRPRRLVRKLELDPEATFEEGPAWSPDGKRIVFVGGTRLYSDLYVATVDGKFLRRMTDNTVEQVTDRQPTWQRLAPR
jgi:Tol biopolymer transport system component